MSSFDSHSHDVALVTLGQVNDSVKADMIRNALIERDIACEIGGEHQAGFTGTFAIDIIVKQTDLEAARKIAAEQDWF